MTAATATTPTARSTRGLVPVLALSAIAATMSMSLVTPLLGKLPTIFSTTPANATWVVTITVFAAAVSNPVLGRLADMFGKKRMLLVALVPLMVGSIICAVSTSLAPMIIGRGLQGVATGMVPLAIAALHDLLPPEKVGGAIALTSSSLGVGGAIGLPIAATVEQYASWRDLFWGMAVIAVVFGVMIWVIVPATKPIGGRHFDLVGALVLSFGLVCLLLGISEGGTWGWTSGLTLGAFGLAVVVLLGWGWWELRAKHPLVDLRATARRTVLLTNLGSIMIGFGMYGQNLIVPQIMQLSTATGYGHGLSMLEMGLWQAPGGIMMMAFSPVGARLTAARGPKTTFLTGATIMAIGYVLQMFMITQPVPLVALASCIISTGVAFAFGAMPALIMGNVPAAQKAAANSFNGLMRTTGFSLSAASVGEVLAIMREPFHGALVPTLDGFRAGLLIGGCAAVLAVIIVSFARARDHTPTGVTVLTLKREAEATAIPIDGEYL